MIRILLCLIMTLLLPNISNAEQNYANGCDPSQHQECEYLAWLYQSDRHIHSPRKNDWFDLFPEDQARSTALYKMSFTGALEGCKQGDATHCYNLTNRIIKAPFDLSDRERIETIALANHTLETKCAEGSVFACEKRAGLTGNQDQYIIIYGPEFTRVFSTIFKNDEKFKSPEDYKREIARQRVKTISPACEDGNADACKELAQIFLKSIPRSPEPGPDILKKNRNLQIKACRHGSYTACSKLTSIFAKFRSPKTRNVTDQDQAEFQETATMLNKFCQGGNPAACNAYLKFPSIKLTKSQIMKRSCAAGTAEDCTSLGLQAFKDYIDLPKQPDGLQKAIKYWEQGCALKDAKSCHALEHAAKL